MPVVTVYFDRLFSMLKGEISKNELVDIIPYLGLDIEEKTEQYIKIEYNPNRPDYSTDYGLGRSLNGILEFETGNNPMIIGPRRPMVKNIDAVQEGRFYDE